MGGSRSLRLYAICRGQACRHVARDVVAAVAFGHRLLEPDLLRAFAEPYTLRRMARNTVEQRREHLRIVQAHIVIGMIDDGLGHHELVARYPAQPPDKPFDRIVELDRKTPRLNSSH